MDDTRGQLLPAYFVVDESGSMSEVVEDLNNGLQSLHDAMQLETMAAATVRLAVMGFSGDTYWHLPLSDLRTVDRMPTFSDRENTSYAAAFKDLKRRIPADIQDLKSQGFRVHRPALFFLSDGNPDPNDGWERPLEDLKSEAFREHPNIVAFGFGQVTPQVILDVATNHEFAFIAAKGTDVGRALADFFNSLTHSIVSSGQQVADGNASLIVQKPDSFQLAIDYV